MRRLRSELALVGIAIACGCDVSAPVDAGEDASIIDAGAPDTGRLVCGDGRVGPTESCDDGNLDPGDACDPSCRWAPFCGDGVVDDGEVCDDGNGAHGDGCALLCASDETCGNGHWDPLAGEACDGEPGCGPDCAWPSCGDGVLDPGEACDDGGLASFDGCGADCRPERAFSLSEIEIAPAERGCDVTADGLVDNRFAQWLRSARAPLSTFLNETLLLDLFLVVGLHGLDDPSAADDPRVLVSLLEAWDANERDDDNAAEGTPLFVLSDWMARPGRPEHAIAGSIAGGLVEAGPGSLLLRLRTGAPQTSPCDLSIRTLTFPLERARLRARVAGVGDEPIYLEDALVCGGLPVRAIATQPNVFAELLTFRPCDGHTEPTLVDLILGGSDLAGIPLAPVTPDMDLDLDGLERFELDSFGPVGCQAVVSACIDGDGTRFDGHDCVYRPEIADAISSAFEVTATIATIAGIVGDDEACALAR